ncbi:MAG: SHOCT domain-containing protein [Thermodesulfobacteriota bacterium]
MKTTKTRDLPGLFKSIFMAHFILFLHVFLIAGLGFLVLFFRGIVFYLPWIFFGGAVILGGAGYLIYRRLKNEGKTVKEIISLPVFRGRSVEVSLFGGLASLKVSAPQNLPILDSDIIDAKGQLEDPTSIPVRELTELLTLLDKKLITIEEYNKAKQKLLGL